MRTRLARHACMRVALALACAAALALPAVPALAEEASAGEAEETPAQGQVLDAASLSEQVDAYVQSSAGGWDNLTVIVTQGGQDVLARTYTRQGSSADAREGDAGVAYDWGRTSDLLVWCAVMQLVQQGSLSLESRVALRLPDGVSLPDGCESLTMLDLMNHASGLNASPKSLSSVQARSGDSVTSFLRDVSLTVQSEPGSVVAYSPADAALAAAVVEQVSGQSIGDYLRANVTEPLGMDATTVSVGSGEAVVDEGLDDEALLTGGHDGDAEGVVRGFLNNPVVSCAGTASDLAKLEGALMGLAADDDAPVLARRSSDTLFTVSRTFPSLGTPRVAHGMFVLPLATDAFGMSGSTWSGFSACAYMRAADEVGVVVLADEAWRDDLTLGLARVVFGHAEVDGVSAALAASDAPPSSDDATWVGVYQDSSLPTHGPAKLLSALGRTYVTAREHEGAGVVLEADSSPLAPVGLGVYVDARADDQDAYRFHVALTGGVSFSRVESDALVVPTSTLVIEGCLLASAALAVVGVSAYVLMGLVSLGRARLARAAWGGQGAPLACAALTLACAAWNVAVLAWPDASAALALFPLVRWANLVYVLAGCALEVWLFVTRWRGTARAPRRLAACVAVMACVLAAILNLVYWEMLP